MTPTQILIILRARRRLIGIVFASTILLVLVVSLIWPNTYVAEASVVLNSITVDPVSGIEQPSELLPSNLATQLDVIASRNVALRVVDKLNLTKNPYFKEKYESATTSIFGFKKQVVGSIRDYIADRLLLKNLDVVPPKEGNVIGIDLAAYDPQFAANLANAFADAYVQTYLDLKMQPSQGQATWFNKQIEDLKGAVESAQAKLSAYQREKNVVGTDDRIDVENSRLVEISDQLIAAQTEMYEGQTRLKQMNEALKLGQLQELPDIEGNPLLQNLKANLGMAEAKLAQISSSFGNNHPDYISAAAQVKELQRKLLAEVDIARGSISQSAQISARKEAELRQALEKQRDRVLALKREQDELDEMKREVADAQTAYDAAVQRATQVHLESRLDKSNIAILNPAVPPMKVARPKMILNLALSIVLGAMFGISAAMAAELLNPRVRSGADLSLSGIEVLAEVPRVPRNRRGILGRRRTEPPLLTSQVAQI